MLSNSKRHKRSKPDSPYSRLGYYHGLQATPWPKEYDSWPINEQRNYEKWRLCGTSIRVTNDRVVHWPKGTAPAELRTIATRHIAISCPMAKGPLHLGINLAMGKAEGISK